MKVNNIFAVVLAFFLLIGCQRNAEEWKDPNQCDFIKESGFIKTHYELGYDIVPGVDFDPSNDALKVGMNVYNYGGGLRINQSAIENIYSAQLAQMSHYYVVHSDNVALLRRLDDEVYGTYAFGSVQLPEFGKYFEDVFVSPLAFRYLNEADKDDSDCLVFVRLMSISDNCVFNGLFLGDFKTEHIINNCYSDIVTNKTFSFKVKGQPTLWKSLLTNEQMEAWNSYTSAVSMGLEGNLDSPEGHEVIRILSR